MKLLPRTRLRVALVLLAGGTAVTALQAQTVPQTSPATTTGADDPGIALSRNLATLSESPNNLNALLGAGNAAVALGDPEAALTFLGKAEELAPRDGRVKAGIGSALVMMEQGRTALRFFEEARTLGAPEADYAGYRGLAYDLTGDTARAQRDYRLALTRRDLVISKDSAVTVHIVLPLETIPDQGADAPAEKPADIVNTIMRTPAKNIHLYRLRVLQWNARRGLLVVPIA